jgi:hypothetical protein
LQKGSLVAIITLPANFSSALAHGQPITLQVAVDNVNTDMTDDVQRALPSAIVNFGRQHHFPGIRMQAVEVDLVGHDTGFIPYLVVSGLALDAFLIASILSAMALAREFETGTIKLLAIAPVHPLLSILGRMLAVDVIASIAMLFPVAIAIGGYGIIPLHPLEMAGVMFLCIAIFGCIGVLIGVVLKRTLPVVSLIVGLGFPLYLCSGSLEPQRFDGNIIWALAHISPVYYAVGILEDAFHGLQVTPEPQWLNFVILLTWAALMLLFATILLRSSFREKARRQRVVREEALLHSMVRRWRQPRLLRRAIPAVLAVLLLLAMGVGIWQSEQQHRAEALLRQQQQQAMLAAAEAQRETGLLNGYTQRVSSLLAQNPQLYTNRTDRTRGTIAGLTQDLWRLLNPEHKVTLLLYLYKERFLDDDFQVVSLKGVDFHGCNMANIDLSDSDLSGANFSSADMHGSKLSSSTLIAVNFTGTNLVGADLKVTDMHDVVVQNANLAGADMVGVVGITVPQLLQAHSLAGTRLPDGSVQPGVPVDNDD